MTTAESGWKAEMADSFTRIEDLFSYLRLHGGHSEKRTEAMGRFPLRVTRSFASRMEKGNPNDPLLLQVLPIDKEMLELPEFVGDPVGDVQSIAVPGVLHKYHGRALLITTGACAINCRYCFRREFPYAESQLSHSKEAQALTHLAHNPTINEVILSGGDPLALEDARLASLVQSLAAIPHINRLRIHSRFPIVLPSRATPNLAKILTATRLKLVLVVHANHAKEFDSDVAKALSSLRQTGMTLLNQSVLLKGINDSVEALAELSERLFELGVLPYYLHMLDKARGTGHFEVSEPQALELHEKLRRRLPGYLVPKLVRETAGAPYKLSV